MVQDERDLISKLRHKSEERKKRKQTLDEKGVKENVHCLEERKKIIKKER